MYLHAVVSCYDVMLFVSYPTASFDKGLLVRVEYDQRPYIIETMHSYTLPM